MDNVVLSRGIILWFPGEVGGSTSSKVLGRVFGWREVVELRDQSFWVLAGRWLVGSVRSVAVGGQGGWVVCTSAH